MYSNISYDDILKSILDNIGNDIDKREGSFTYDMIAPTALKLQEAYLQFDKMLATMFVSDCSGEYLDKRISEYGIKRKDGTKANGAVRFYGANNITIAKGTMVQTSDNLVYITSEGGTITNGYVDIDIVSEDIGIKYNVASNTITNLPVSLIGVTSISNVESVNGGSDIEDDESLIKRFLNQVQSPSTSGNKAHYKQWALENEEVGEAEVLPLWNGPGTVKVIIVDRNKKPAREELVEEVRSYIESVRPIGATVTVASANGVNVTIAAKVILSDVVNIDTVSLEFEKKISEYFEQIAIISNTIFYSKVGSILSDIEGVIDYTDLRINGLNSNLVLAKEDVAVLSSIQLV